jgi:micrococcal nuclease
MSTTTPSTRGERALLIGGIALSVLLALAAVVGGIVWFARDLRAHPIEMLADRDHPAVGATPTVDEVIDGDTIVVSLRGHHEKVRLLGIDTPETKDPRKPVQCFGKEASDRTKALLPGGTAVRLVRDVEERDRYDRLLAYVYRADDGLFVNLELARGGYADVLTYPPNVAHTTELQGAVADARREQRGLWQACGGPGRPA